MAGTEGSIYLQLIVFGLVWGGLYALMASGLNLIYGVMKLLNIGHGEFVMLGGYLAYTLFTYFGISPLLSLFLIGPAMFLLGWVIKKVAVDKVIKPGITVDALERATLILSFGILLIIQNSALLIWTADYQVITYLADPVEVFGVSIALNRVIVLVVAVLLTVAMHFFLNRTMVGKAIRGVSQDRETAQLMGIDIKVIGVIGFGVGLALAGIAGGLLSMVYVLTPHIGLIFTVKAFTVMILGGLGSQVGVLVAGIAIGLLESWFSFVGGEAYKDVIGYVLLIAFILVVPKLSLLFKKGEISR